MTGWLASRKGRIQCTCEYRIAIILCEWVHRVSFNATVGLTLGQLFIQDYPNS
jgi:hypothetical protein